MLTEYYSAQKAVKAACKSARRAFMDQKLAIIESQLKDEPEKAWKTIYEMAGKRKMNGVGPIRKGENDVTFNTAEKLRVFAEQYAILGRDEVPKIRATTSYRESTSKTRSSQSSKTQFSRRTMS